jgi:hypothetical protein
VLRTCNRFGSHIDDLVICSSTVTTIGVTGRHRKLHARGEVCRFYPIEFKGLTS